MGAGWERRMVVLMCRLWVFANVQKCTAGYAIVQNPRGKIPWPGGRRNPHSIPPQRNFKRRHNQDFLILSMNQGWRPVRFQNVVWVCVQNGSPRVHISGPNQPSTLCRWSRFYLQLATTRSYFSLSACSKYEADLWLSPTVERCWALAGLAVALPWPCRGLALASERNPGSVTQQQP
jgi:hypothetical protein